MKNFLMMVVIAASVQLALAADLSDEMKAQNKKIVSLVVEEMSKGLPETIDDYTQLVEIKSRDLALIYIFEINTGLKSDDTVRKEDRSRMQRAVTQGLCQSSKRFLDAQITISYLYRSAKTKAKLFQFDIAQTDCIEKMN
ncbi:MAG: hypothetical protein MUP09_06490 [Thiovulaceae bacterium]|nr:hypothetical protein [Sulfurimonadaceae bacterium]